MRLLLSTTCFTMGLLLLLSCNNTNLEKENYKKIEQSATISTFKDGYVGDQSCIACHDNAYNSWKGSHHDLAMQIANDSTVLGDFDNVKTTIDGVSYLFYKNKSDFIVQIKEIDGLEKEYKIAYTFGVTPLQQYLIDFEKGKKQVLRVTWDVVNKKWYHQYAGDKIAPHDWLHWTKSAQNWNTMCAECHSTNLKKNYFVEKDSFHTTYSAINVSCESCHGPAEKHIHWANSKKLEGNTYILKGKTQKEQLKLCAPCHARRVKLTQDLIPGKLFEDQYMVQNLTTNLYHGDGQIDDEDYVYASFLQSKMYAEGVKCNDCHNVHTTKLKFEGNKLCLQCHVSENYDTEKHHFHKENTKASLCVNCHMTGKNYMGNDFRRDHSFRIPRPDQSKKYDTPNACTGCHKDKNNQWAAKKIKKNYGNKKAVHFSDGLLLSSQEAISESDRTMLDGFINDLQFPAIARATVIENLDYYTESQYATLLTALNDTSAHIRYNALLKFRNLAPEDRKAIALRHVDDSVKLVRIGAAQLVIGIDESTLNSLDRSHLSKAQGELETMMYSSADFSTGRLQLGDYYLQYNDLNAAIKHYEMALKMDSLLLPVYSNLATAYSLNKDYEAANKTLDKWISLEPSLSRPHYLKALLNFEIHNNVIAVAELEAAIGLNPNDTRSMYNLATYYFQDKKDLPLAEKYIKMALKVDVNNQDFNYLLALIYRDQGALKSSQEIMKTLKGN